MLEQYLADLVLHAGKLFQYHQLHRFYGESPHQLYLIGIKTKCFLKQQLQTRDGIMKRMP